MFSLFNIIAHDQLQLVNSHQDCAVFHIKTVQYILHTVYYCTPILYTTNNNNITTLQYVTLQQQYVTFNMTALRHIKTVQYVTLRPCSISQ